MDRNRRVVRRSRWRGAVLSALLAIQTGCYSYLPIQSQPPMQDERIQVVLNDTGRTLLASRVGPFMDKIEGRPVSIDSSSVTLLVYRTENIRGEVSTWTGESVVLPREGIMGYQARKVSKAKTLVLVGIVVGAVVASALSTQWTFGGPGRRDNDPGPIGEAR